VTRDYELEVVVDFFQAGVYYTTLPNDRRINKIMVSLSYLSPPLVRS
jgi:hypothetical protein